MEIKKLIYKFYIILNIIVNRVFWNYFMIMVLYRFIISKNIRFIVLFIFPFYLGCIGAINWQEQPMTI